MVAGASLNGFTLTSGSTLNFGFAEQVFGAGIYCESSNALILNCILATNSAGYAAGGVFQGSLSNCILNNNSASDSAGGALDSFLNSYTLTANIAATGGGAFGCFAANSDFDTNSASDGGAAASCSLYNCILAFNTATDGGGGAFQSGLTNCVIVGNSAYTFGGGVYQSALTGCILTNNSAFGNLGGGAYASGLTNCLIIGNSAGGGGGAGICTLNNCTVVYNSATVDGGISSRTTAYNSIIYYNTVQLGNATNYDPNATLNYCCTTPAPANGENNLTNAPQFVNIMSDFHLQSSSPCINEGNNSYLTETNDLDGNPRIVCGTVDMGAYEYQASIPMTLGIVADFTNVAVEFPMQLQAIVGQGFATSVVWDFGDGTTATNQLSLSHGWLAPGAYTVTVTVSNSFVPEATSASLAVNVSSQLNCYVDATASNPTPPYSSWETAATNIQDAVNVAQDGGLVLVTNGIYQYGGQAVNGSLLTNRVVINKSIVVESVNGPANTIIEGNQLPTQTIYSGVPNEPYPYTATPDGPGAVRCVCITTNAALIGFTLAGGATLSSGNTNNDESGGGVWCAFTNGIVISNCVITANAAYNQGGGVFQGTLANCIVLGNQAVEGGGVANALVFSSLIVSNAAAFEGGGACNSSLFSSAIAENSATNSEGSGGGAYGGFLLNCTVTGNSALEFGGGIAVCAATNSIIYYNQIFSNYGSYTNDYPGNTYPLTYCCTTPISISPDPGNITNPPILANISHISLNSPCRGAGNPSAANGVDIDGNMWANPPSIGCSEIPSGGDYGNLIVNISTQYTNWALGYPLNFQATISGPCYTTVWNFGDGTIVTNAPYLSHVWSSVGNYPVTLTAYNDSYPTGVTTTAMINIAVPTNYYVNWANPNPVPPYSSWSIAATNIQDAVSVAAPGSLVLVTNPTVVVWEGYDLPSITNSVAVYQNGGATAPNGYFYRAAITNAITVESVNGPSMTCIEGNTSSQFAGCVYMTNGAALSGFTVRTNGTAISGLFAVSTNAMITNCIITHCGVHSGTLYNCAIIAAGSVMSTLNNCLVSNCSSQYGAGALGGILNDCLIISNTATYGGGGFGGVIGGMGTFPLVMNNCVISNNIATYGGGVYSANGPTYCILNNCILTHNSAKNYGGGAYNAELNNCLISSNTAPYLGGGVYWGLLNNCTLTGNSVYGAYDAVLTNCMLTANVAGGADDSTLNQCTLLQNVGIGAYGSTLNNCLLVSNSPPSQGSPVDGGGANNCKLTNCIVAYNIATNGGGAYQSTLVNCTVIANRAVVGGGTYDCIAGNCILYYNTNGDYYPATGQYPLNYCCTLVPVINGVRNITTTPLFVNLAGGDFHLQSSSPCINSGNNAYISSATDLDGNPRIVGGTVDIGAYEYQTPTSVISYAYLQQYGLPTDGSVDFADLDGTTFNVYQDWIAGLNPTNPASILAMQTPIVTTNATGVTVTWQSVSGIPYLLQRSTNLTSQPPFSTIQNITGQSGTTSYTDTSATNNVPYFYRVGVIAP